MIHNFTSKKLNKISQVLGSYQTNGSARKGNKTFSTTLAFSCCLHLSSLSFENAYLLIRFRLLFTLKRPTLSSALFSKAFVFTYAH